MLRHLIQWIGVRLCGYGGSILISAGLAMLTVPLFRLESSWLVEGLVVIALIRYVSHLVTKSSSILSVQMRHHQVKKLLIEQAQFASVFLGICYVMNWPIPRSVAAVFLLADSAAQVALMLVSHPMGKLLSKFKHNRHDSSHKTALIVGTGPKGTWVANTIENSPELDTRVIGFLDYSRTGLWRYQDIPLMGHPDQLENLIIAEHIDAIFIALEPGDIARSDRLFRTAERMGVVVYVLPDVYEPRIAKKSSAQLDGVPAIVYRTSSHSAASVMLKGLLDKFAAIIGLVLSSPIWLAAIIAIKIDSRGPIFFKQVRSGLNGRRFNLYKFRTMCSDAELQKRQLRDRNEMSGPVFKIKNDPRITTVGRFLRKYSVDELPQLVNILKGEMSLVGPRPPIPDEVAKYEPWQRRRLSVKPGLTCLWQVNGRNAIDFDDWMKLDLEYIDNWSLLMDARIVARTVPTVLKGSGI
jgi:exopolysaccharide biosynthesis polyprenyl glycosylphosphotransferase